MALIAEAVVAAEPAVLAVAVFQGVVVAVSGGVVAGTNGTGRDP
jgi:hypothetical protein